jgi:hypothetical protein
MLAGFYKSKLVLGLETIVFTIFPLILLKFYPDLLHLRTPVMAGGLIYVSLFIWSQKISLKQLGFQIANFIPATKPLIKPMLAAIFITLCLFYWWPSLMRISILTEEISLLPSRWLMLFIYPFISVPLQEFIYRAYLVNRVERVSRSRSFLLVYSAFLFTLIHTPFNNAFLALSSFVLGCLLADNFQKYRNLLSVIFGHALAGLAYVLSMSYLI